MDKPKPDQPPKPEPPAPTYMTAPPGGNVDALGRPYPDVQVQLRKPRRRRR